MGNADANDEKKSKKVETNTKQDDKTKPEDAKSKNVPENAEAGGGQEQEEQEEEPVEEAEEEKEDSDIVALGEHGYELGKELGSGSYSQVKLATKDGEQFAVKIISRNLTSRDYREKFMPRELKILGEAKHPHIATVYDILDKGNKVYIVMELALCGDLLDKVQKELRFSERRAHYYFMQLASALAYLHKNDIAHRDLKCENVLLIRPGVLKLTDFSFARYCTNNRTRKPELSETYCGSEAYAPPEILQGLRYLPKADDVWSLGVILYVMMTGILPFEEGNVFYQIRLQMTRNVRFPSKLKLSVHVQNLLRQMLEPVIHLRATMSQVANHNWLRRFTPTNKEPL